MVKAKCCSKASIKAKKIATRKANLAVKTGKKIKPKKVSAKKASAKKIAAKKTTPCRVCGGGGR